MTGPRFHRTMEVIIRPQVRTSQYHVRIQCNHGFNIFCSVIAVVVCGGQGYPINGANPKPSSVTIIDKIKVISAVLDIAPAMLFLGH